MSLESFHMFKYGFWWLFGCPKVIGSTFPTTYKPWERFGEKKIFEFFQLFLKQFLLHFSLKMKQKWTWKNRKSDFFKNEALNQKSGTVKPLGYVSTVFHDRGDPPDLKLAMPPASNSSHEKHGFQELLGASNWRFIEVSKILAEKHVKTQKKCSELNFWCLNSPRGV